MSVSISGRATLRLSDSYFAAAAGFGRFGRIVVVGASMLYAAMFAIAFIFVSPETALVNYSKPLPMAGAAFFLWLALYAFLFRRFSREQKEITYDIDRERVAIRDGTGAAVIRPWSQIRACREYGSGFSLRLRPMGSHWLVKRAFQPEALSAFRALAQSIMGKT